MNKNQLFINFLKELEELDLPKEKYAVFGSGPIAIRGLRDARDIDVIVKSDVYRELCAKYPDNVVTTPVKCIQLGNIEIGDTWLNSQKKINEMINDAENIHGHPFVRLDYLIEWKKKMGRKKDLEDIKLIEEYFKNKK